MTVWNNNKVIVLCLILNLYFCFCYQELYYDDSEEEWLENALRDIAYYLRNHKFNEWDRRFYKTRPAEHLNGFYSSFPTPALQSIHWEVQKHCDEDFSKCITYLHGVIKTAPFTRNDDLTTSLNKNLITINITSLEDQNDDCKRALLYNEKTGLPFGNPKEKFYWRTSASYYMCWYTMKGIPALSMLGESCDNFANCLDIAFGNKNHDPRSNDKLSFACAMYSFCPDPCCPSKHVHELSQCYKNNNNPCYTENSNDNNLLHRICQFSRENNQNFDDIIRNRWNISCYCPQRGFEWSSQFGMCVDKNECLTKQHNCDKETEDCLNLPGSYHCVCKSEYEYDKVKRRCILTTFTVMVPVKLEPIEQNDDMLENRYNFWTSITSALDNLKIF